MWQTVASRSVDLAERMQIYGLPVGEKIHASALSNSKIMFYEQGILEIVIEKSN